MRHIPFLIMATFLAAVACDDGSRDDNDGGNDSDTDSDSDFEWCDETTSLCWQFDTVSLTWDEAMDHCDDLTLGGHENWHLPSVDEFRSLIRGCQATVIEGECPIVDGSDSNDFDTICLGCDFLGNPSHSRGCYWDEGMGDLCTSPEGVNWSSSEDEKYSPPNVWYVDFDEAGVHSTLNEGNMRARCVRAMD